MTSWRGNEVGIPRSAGKRRGSWSSAPESNLDHDQSDDDSREQVDRVALADIELEAIPRMPEPCRDRVKQATLDQGLAQEQVDGRLETHGP